MTEAELAAMPLLIINMGGEMLYILEQRLKAQNIPDDKGQRVHQDVMSTMFSEQFITELFKPQKIYSTSSTRLIFDRLAHSSIMRLNESSMNKLFDLMTMGAKYQVLAAACAEQLEHMSLNHLEALRKMVKSKEVIALLDHAISATKGLFSKLAPGDWILLRHTLARFFQDRRVKVSLFLHDGIQSSDGSIVIQHKGPLPAGAEKPGTIRYFGDDGKVSKEETVTMKNSEGCTESVPRSTLGQNLYAKDRRKIKAGNEKLSKHNHAPSDKEKAFEPDEASQKAATAELNTLAQMLGGGPAPSKDKFTLSHLFPNSGSDDNKNGGHSAEVITFDNEDCKAYMAMIQTGVGFWDDLGKEKKTEEEDEEEDDLLSLMDTLLGAQKEGAKISGGALGPSFKYS